MSTYETDLIGLEIDNVLGFLALLGLLRSIEQSRPDWFPRAYFRGSPLRSTLILSSDPSKKDIAEAASEGCTWYASFFSFREYHDLTFSSDAARELLESALDREPATQILSALFSDGAAKNTDGRIIPTPLCAMFGQGHQSFLDRLSNVALGTLPRDLRKKKNPPDLNDPSAIFRALFAPWTRSDSTESFRWDHQEDRRYALRNINPSSDPATTEHGANRLAILGVLSFQSAPQVAGISGSTSLGTRGFSRGPNRRQRLTWPIWNSPATLLAIEAMLDRPELSANQPDFTTLKQLTVRQLFRAPRIVNGKFINFGRAEALT